MSFYPKDQVLMKMCDDLGNKNHLSKNNVNKIVLPIYYLFY